MSAPEARMSYELDVKFQKKESKLFQIFLDWAISQKADGIIAGATFPEVIKYCKKKSNGKMSIFSPGIGVQGGSVKEVLSSGSDYLIVGRTILNSKNPLKVAEHLKLQSLVK